MYVYYKSIQWIGTQLESTKVPSLGSQYVYAEHFKTPKLSYVKYNNQFNRSSTFSYSNSF